MKKIITLVAGIAIIFGTSTIAFADSTTQTSTDSTQSTQSTSQTGVQVGTQVGNTITLTLDDCLSKIDKVNPTIKIEDAKIKLYEAQYDDDKSNASWPDSDDVNSVGYNLQKSYTWQVSLSTLNDAKHTRDEDVKTLKNNLTSKYLSALADQQDVESIKAEIANLETKMDQTSKKIELGQATSTDLDTVETSKSTLQSTLNTTQAQIESELLTIKQYLGIDLNKDIKLTDVSKELVKYDDTAIESSIQNAVNKNYDLQKAQDDIDLTKTERGIYLSYDADNNTTIRQLDISIKSAQDALASAKLSKQISLMSSYYTLKNAEDSVEAAKLNLQIAQSTFDSSEIKFNSGTIDKVERETNRIALEQAKTTYQRAVNDYMVTVESFKIAMEE